MEVKEELINLSKQSDGVFQTADLLALGLNKYRIRKLLEDNIIERIKPGYYSLYSTFENLSEAGQIKLLFPDGVLCMHTALFHYHYSDRTPLAWDIAVDKDTSKSRFNIDYPYIQPYYLEQHMLSFGVVQGDFDNFTLNIFDRDRLICECIFYENKMDRETYNKAIQGYINDNKKSVDHLLNYAKERRILNKVKLRIGVWL